MTPENDRSRAVSLDNVLDYVQLCLDAAAIWAKISIVVHSMKQECYSAIIRRMAAITELNNNEYEKDNDASASHKFIPQS